jgi:hypothetical protein
MEDKELSGAELDRAIAERVMGWEPVEGMTALAPFAYKRPDGHIVHPYSVPKYSESIEAAMRVIEKMHERRFRVSITNPLKVGTRANDNIAVWYVEFDRRHKCEPFSAESGSLPEAISRCALAAIETKDEL